MNSFFDLLDFDSILDEDFRGKLKTFAPSVPYDLYRDKDGNAVISLALAGYKRENIDINFQDDEVRIQVDKVETKDKDVKCIHNGIKRSATKNCFVVPSSRFDHSKAEATFVDGMLTIRVPQKEETKPHKLDISS